MPPAVSGWSNNLAEQAVRMMKIQQKVSGGFRTETGAINSCRIRSYVITLQKNHVDLFDGIMRALAGQPWLPPETHPVTQVQESQRSDQLRAAA